MSKTFNSDLFSKLYSYKIKIFISLIGIVLSIYSIYHFLEVTKHGSSDLFCNINQLFNCDEVALSKYGKILDIPLSVLALAYFFTSAMLVLIAAKRKDLAFFHYQAYQFLVVFGSIFSLILFFISYFNLKVLCITCVFMYILIFLQLIFLFYYKDFLSFNFSLDTFKKGISTLIVSFISVIAVYTILMQLLSRPSNYNQVNIEKKLDEDLNENNFLSKNKCDMPIKISKFLPDNLSDDFYIGDSSSKVKVVIVMDLRCPACARFEKNMKDVINELKDKVLFVFKDYQLGMRKNELSGYSFELSKLSRCAGMNGKFFQAKELIFEHTSKGVNLDGMIKILKETKTPEGEYILSDKEINLCESEIIRKKIESKIKQDRDIFDNQIHQDCKLSGTPAVYINNRQYTGRLDPYELKIIIEQML